MNYLKPEVVTVGAAIQLTQSGSMSKMFDTNDSQVQPSDPAYQADE